MHLAQSFDTLGWLTRDLRDLPLLAEALFGLPVRSHVKTAVRIGAVSADFLHDCEPPVIAAFTSEQRRLRDHGAKIVQFDAAFWDGALEIFAPIQAHEAAAIHKGPTGGDFSHFERSIAERLAWGASISKPELETLRKRHAAFREHMDRTAQESFRLSAGAQDKRLRL